MNDGLLTACIIYSFYNGVHHIKRFYFTLGQVKTKYTKLKRTSDSPSIDHLNKHTKEEDSCDQG